MCVQCAALLSPSKSKGGSLSLFCTYVFADDLGVVSARFQMSSQPKIPPLGAKQSRWGHPLVMVASLLGLAGSSAVYYANIRARQKARNMFLEQSFFDEALELTRGYKPITEKLVAPVQPLQLDPMSKFNVLALNSAQVSLDRSFLLRHLVTDLVCDRTRIRLSLEGTERLLLFR